ncbi:hypothetical protein M8818_002060 [Zalaria obscura]|uniref:Uncharacterized protein n=1 Tax=Zalaria obscura TaxID=2024903 RepID=A0ACC3SIV2_9PEZI
MRPTSLSQKKAPTTPKPAQPVRYSGVPSTMETEGRAKKGSIRSAVRRLFSRKPKEVQEIKKLSPPRHGYHRSRRATLPSLILADREAAALTAALKDRGLAESDTASDNGRDTPQPEIGPSKPENSEPEEVYQESYHDPEQTSQPVQAHPSPDTYTAGDKQQPLPSNTSPQSTRDFLECCRVGRWDLGGLFPLV